MDIGTTPATVSRPPALARLDFAGDRTSAVEERQGIRVAPTASRTTKKKADVEKAFAFVAKTIGRKKGDPGPGRAFGYGGAIFDADAIGDLYFLWTLERVSVIYSKEKIGGKNWYDWGYPLVMKEQLPDGSWSEKHSHPFGPLIDTPFALLFLKRTNIAKDLTNKLRELMHLSQVQAVPVPALPRR